MKNILVRMVLLLLCIALQQCNEENETVTANPEKIQFTCNLSSSDLTNGRLQAKPLPTELVLSLTNSAGVPVLTNKNIKLLRVNNTIITEPINLSPGSYKITDFLLVVDSVTVLYATPKFGSSLANVVAHSLPYSFVVSKNNVSTIEMDVIDVTQHKAEEFGYASFGINHVNIINLSVFTGDDHIVLTSAKAFILQGTDTLKRYSLDAKVNTITFKGDPEALYQLVVVKTGYNTYTKDFVYNDFIDVPDNNPLKVLLVRTSFTILAYADNSFDFSLRAITGSTFTINWGDGSSTAVTAGFDEQELGHSYATTGNFPINITGDLDQIIEFYSYYGGGQMDAINVQGLTNLRSISIGWFSRGPRIVDLTNNPKVSYINMGSLENLEHLILPPLNTIKFITLAGTSKLSTTDVDDIIDKVYKSAILHSLLGGTIDISKYATDYNGEVVGPPSPASFDKLSELHDYYSWTILPEL